MKCVAIVLALFCWLPNAMAHTCLEPRSVGSGDRVLFHNGDVLTGEVSSIDRTSVRFHSLALGDLVVPWDAIAQVQSSGRAVASEIVGPPDGAALPFDTAMVTRSNDGVTLKLDDRQPRIVSAALTFSDPPCDATAHESPSHAAAPPDTRGVVSRWFLDVNAPASFAFGTSSQETFGGAMTFELYEGNLNHTRLAAAGAYNRSWQVKSPFVSSDTMDAFFQQGRSFGTNRGGIYGKAEAALNTSLGQVLEESFGGGYYSPTMGGGPLQYKWLADLRYFRERLYATPADLNLIGSRLENQLIYRKADSADKTKTRYSLILDAWVNPMWNNEKALEGSANVQVSVPLGPAVCFSFVPVEEDYLRNAPAGNRKNYVTSSLSLVIKHGSDPHQKCY